MRRLALIASAILLTVSLSPPGRPFAAGTGAAPVTPVSQPATEPTAAALATGPEITALELVRRLADGEVVDLSEVTVTGHLDLRDVQTVRRPFRCIGCAFTGSIAARDVTFEGILDLSGSQVDGSLDFRGAVFDRGFLLRGSPDHPAQVNGPVSFAQATLGDGTGFDRAILSGASDFTGSNFLGESSFADALFQDDALFNDASFGGNALFSSLALAGLSDPPTPCQPPVMGAFVGAASFNRAAFRGTADFRLRCFVGTADFRTAAFGSRVDFGLSIFHSDALFDGASFESDGAFLASIFEANASFLQVAASGSLNFEEAVFGRDAGFFRLSVSGTLSFQDALFREGVDLRRALVTDLMMDLDDVGNVVGRARERQDVLALIENSADQRGDLGLANDARFQLLALQNTRFGWFLRSVDWFFYRLIAGYLVRPLYPLLAFLGLLLVGALIRTALRLQQGRSPSRRAGTNKGSQSSRAERGHARILGATKVASAFFQRLGDTIQVAFRRKPLITLEETEQVRAYVGAGVKWVEYIAFKVLIALFLLALASSNATLKQLIESVRG
ncbi:MAG: pentapeptide repeat-containing protein [Actinomycetota bacterium]